MTPDDIWTAKECAAFLKLAPRYFLRKVRFQPGFPDQLEWSKMGHPRWSSAAVREWALRQNYAKAA